MTYFLIRIHILDNFPMLICIFLSDPLNVVPQKSSFLLKIWRRSSNKLVRAKMRPKEGAKIELLGEICQILSDLSDLQV